jgi:hypothetical protein
MDKFVLQKWELSKDNNGPIIIVRMITHYSKVENHYKDVKHIGMEEFFKMNKGKKFEMYLLDE